MAKKSMIARDIKRKNLIDQYSKKRKHIKSTIKQKKNNFNEQLEAQQILQSLPKNSAPARLRRRCWVTGRSRGYFRAFGLSRHALREMTHNCLIPGLKKASW